jgi:hypothetical protein
MPRINLPSGLKRCACCKLDKTAADDFGVDRRRPDGLNVYCKSCIRSKLTQSREANPEKHREYSASERERNPQRKMVDSAKRRALSQGVPFNISATDIQIPKTCPVCDKKIIRNTGQNSGGVASPSLDRWEPALGYIPGNVWVVCLECNIKKGHLSGNEMVEFGWRLIESWKRAQEKENA